MKIRHTFLLLLGLTAWVALSAVRIERLNAAAGYYLPRHDEDGKWRISRENAPRDQLRGLVSSIGLLQYVLAPLVVGLAGLLFLMCRSGQERWLAAACGIVGLAALGLAFYRGYFLSLGW